MIGRNEQSRILLPFVLLLRRSKIAPRVFSADRDGACHSLAVHLRTIVDGFGQRDERRQRQEMLDQRPRSHYG
jgi:hypothetical protein